MLKLLRGAAAAPEPPASVLADWNAYATSGADEESVLAPLSAVTGRIGDAARKVKESAAGAAANVPSGSSLQLAVMLFSAGGALLLIAFFVALPVLVLSPGKFALSFTLGNGLVLSGTLALSGVRASCAHACSPERAPLSCAYAATAGGTLYSALSLHSYLLSLLCSAMQVAALAALVASYVPGGLHGLRLLASTGARALGGVAAAAFSR